MSEAEKQPPHGDGQEPVASNYRYWQEHGGEWADEYDRRKLVQPYYHVQEIMLAEYFFHSAPAKVLEFGCGVGRHLRYLSQIPGIEIFGYDQSPTMAAGCLRWTSQKWIDQHVTIGPPVGRLPFEDKAFDIVYTAEVLVHVRPEDLGFILTELTRIARQQVLHIERSLYCEIVSGEHSGCWEHDLVTAYARIGRDCQLLPFGYEPHSPYRVILDPAARVYTWSPLMIAMYRRLEKDLRTGMSQLQGEAWSKAAELETKSRKIEELTEWAHAREAELQRQLTALSETVEQQMAEMRPDDEAELARHAQLEQQLAQMRSTLEHLVGEATNHHSQLHEIESTAQMQRADMARQIASLQEALNERVTALQQHEVAAQERQQQLEQQLVALQAALAEKVEIGRRADELERQLIEARERLEAEMSLAAAHEDAAQAQQAALEQQLSEVQGLLEEETVRAAAAAEAAELRQREMEREFGELQKRQAETASERIGQLQAALAEARAALAGRNRALGQQNAMVQDFFSRIRVELTK